MRDILDSSLKRLKWSRIFKNLRSGTLLVLSLIVSLHVFWALRQPGLTLAGDADCGIPEHTHKDECITQVCICALSEEAHVHEEACYTTRFTEAQENLRLVCTQVEDPHVHEDSCYERIVTDSGEETVLHCELPCEPHTHTENCYAAEITEAQEERILTCILSETAHIHEDGCYSQEHTCELQEHTHNIDCYSDETADVETLLDWQNMFADYPFTEDLREDLVGIAKTQVGYSESTRNFAVGSDGIRRGYTRYGAWYGTPYRDWSAAFVSFCLNYAGADPEQMPGNIGADAMAELWKKLDRFVPAGEYIPVSGDLVFFEDNIIGIVTEVQNATFYMIRGDIDDAVRTDTMLLNDEAIIGWGITEEFDEEPPTDTAGSSAEDTAAEPTWEELMDISNGPVFHVFAEGESAPQAQMYSFQNSRMVTDLIWYLNSIQGSYTFSILNTNNQEPPEESDNHFIITAETLYKLTLRLNSDSGFAPGTYQYQLPQGIQVNSGTGKFILSDGTYVGDWEVTSNGLITIVFNEKMNNRTMVTISATMGVWFPAQDEPIGFDGKIFVTVAPPPQEETTTTLNKWGVQGAEGAEQNKTDPTKLYWTMTITGKQNSQIPGSVITDHVKTGDHLYTQSDMAAGLKFGASDPNGEWHSWTVYPGDPNLVWTETEWTYTIPETITCWCGQVILGNNNWTYYVDYTSTPTPINTTGSFWYTNEVTIDGHYTEGWGQFVHSGTDAGIVKTGNFQGDADGSVFLWEFQATIPGRNPDARAAYYTQIVDQLYVKDANNATIAYIQNDANNATVTAVYNGQTITVPHASTATSEDEFAWVVGWSEENNGVSYTRSLLPLCRCHCTEASCHYWNAGLNRCDAYHYLDTGWSGFCYCWTPEEAITFTFSYTTTDPTVLKAYGGQKYNLLNQVSLQQNVYQPDGTDKTVIVGEAHAKVPIPGIFKKELTQDFNGYTAQYEITVNEAKLPLTNGTPLTIYDVMTDTLAYISGSLVITTEDLAGNTGTLHPGTDYTVTYDGTGDVKDAQGNSVHVMEITVLHPQPVKYVLDYDATLIIPPGTTEDVKYSNYATISLWGEDLSVDSEEKVYADFSIAATHYRVELHKVDSRTGAPLEGATFGLFNEHGGMITSDVTQGTGNLLFETNIVQGIILQEHSLYYLQEIQAPPGYQLDNQKHWFCFCNSTEDTCETCFDILEERNGYRIPFDIIGVIEAENELMNYNLPATGGPGIYPLILVSVLFIVTPLVYAAVHTRRRDKRSIR